MTEGNSTAEKSPGRLLFERDRPSEQWQSVGIESQQIWEARSLSCRADLVAENERLRTENAKLLEFVSGLAACECETRGTYCITHGTGYCDSQEARDLLAKLSGIDAKKGSQNQ